MRRQSSVPVGSSRNKRRFNSPDVAMVELSCCGLDKSWLGADFDSRRRAMFKDLKHTRIIDSMLRGMIISSLDCFCSSCVRINGFQRGIEQTSGKREPEGWGGEETGEGEEIELDPFLFFHSWSVCQNPIDNYHQCPVQSSVCPLRIWLMSHITAKDETTVFGAEWSIQHLTFSQNSGLCCQIQLPFLI